MSVLNRTSSCEEHSDKAMWYDYGVQAWQCDICFDDTLASWGCERKWTEGGK